MGNSIGKVFKLTTFGESHGKAIGGIIEGCPSNISLDLKAIQMDLDRRKPGQSAIVTQRKESDAVEFLSGLFEGKTTGMPIGFQIKNENKKSKDYDHIKDSFRPSHADYTYQSKYGIRDYRGGGRSSARETANWVVAGGIAKQIIPNIEIKAYVSSVGNIHVIKDHSDLDLNSIEQTIVRCPDLEVAEQMIQLIKEVKKEGDTIGGVITCVAKNVPVGLGEPVFNKLHAQLGKAMLSINAAKAFEFGAGFYGATKRGSQLNDIWEANAKTKTNHSGGIQGGISNGMDIYFRVAFKPVATLMQDQASVNAKGESEILKGKGRHDPCVVPRAVPIIEALTALVLTDFMLLKQSNKVRV